MAAIQPNTAAQIGQAQTMQKNMQIPIDVIPDDSFARLYKPGQRTLGGKELDENTRQHDVDLQEAQRAAKVREALAQSELDETIRANKADEAYKLAALNRSGSGGGSSSLTSTEMLNAIRNGAIQYAQGLMNNPKTFTVKRGLLKGQVGQEDAYSPEQAANSTVQMLQGKMGGLPISSANYNDIVKSVYTALGLQPPKTTSSETSEDDLAAMKAKLGL